MLQLNFFYDKCYCINTLWFVKKFTIQKVTSLLITIITTRKQWKTYHFQYLYKNS